MPRTIKRQLPNGGVQLLQKLLYSNGYLREQIPADGIFEQITHDEVLLFQMQHIDRDRLPLKVDGEVGRKTWWALMHPSGEAQRNHFAGSIPENLTTTRSQLLQLLFAEHDKPVVEVPDGSNRNPDIDGYWGDTGVIGMAWCCAFVSWALFESLGRYPVGGTHHLGVQRMWRAAQRIGMATSEPKPGDIFIQIKSNGKGHTGFVVGLSEDGSRVHTCEGNCGNRIKLGNRLADTIDHYLDCIDDSQGLDFGRSDLSSTDLAGEKDR